MQACGALPDNDDLEPLFGAILEHVPAPAYDDEAPLQANVANAIPDLGPLRNLIDAAIDEQGAVRDSASPELGSIRRGLIAAHDRLQQRLQSLLSSTSMRNALQDAIIVMRDGRYVLPVKADFRGAVRGVVHDTDDMCADHASAQHRFLSPPLRLFDALAQHGVA